MIPVFVILLITLANAQVQVNNNNLDNEYYLNPIFAGNYPDPSVLRDGHDYYIANLRGWQFPAEKNVIQNHVFLKLRNIENTVDMYYSTDGIQ